MAEIYDYPSAEDVALWDKYDATYGMDYAGALRKGAPGRTVPASEIEKVGGDENWDKQPYAEKVRRMKALEAQIASGPMDKDHRDRLMRAFIASRRSGIASLGYDPTDVVMSKETKGQLKNVAGLNIGGKMYEIRDPNIDPSTSVHEAMHQGIKGTKISRSNRDPEDRSYEGWGKWADDNNKLNSAIEDKATNENIVRALMQKNYGDIEMTGSFQNPAAHERGTKFLLENPDFLDELEQMASDELKKRGRPMGPR